MIISGQDNNTFYIDWQDQGKGEIFKYLQERDNNYRNIVLPCSRVALSSLKKRKICPRATKRIINHVEGVKRSFFSG